MLPLGLLSQSAYDSTSNDLVLLTQTNTPYVNHNYWWDFKAKHKLQINAWFNNAAKGIPQVALNQLLFSGGIDENAKQAIFNRLHKNNNLFVELGGSVNYSQYCDLPLFGQGRFHTSYIREQNIYGSASQDALSLAFFGNAIYEDDTASLNNILFEQYTLNELQLGFDKLITREENLFLAYGFSLSVMESPRYSDFQLENAFLYTAPYGQFISTSYQFSYKDSKESSLANGMGFSTAAAFQIFAENAKLALSISRLGLIFYGDGNQVSADTSYQFSGIDVEFDRLEEQLSNLNADSLQYYAGVKRRDVNLNYRLKPRVNLDYAREIGKFLMQLSFMHEFRKQFIPQSSAYGYYKFSLNSCMGIGMHYGGYQAFGMGIHYGQQIKQMQINLGARNMAGILNPSQWNGAGAYLQINQRF